MVDGVKSIRRKYVICKLIQEKTVVSKESLVLPSYRVSCNHTFENVWLDFVVPLYSKDDFFFHKKYECYKSKAFRTNSKSCK